MWGRAWLLCAFCSRSASMCWPWAVPAHVVQTGLQGCSKSCTPKLANLQHFIYIYFCFPSSKTLSIMRVLTFHWPFVMDAWPSLHNTDVKVLPLTDYHLQSYSQNIKLSSYLVSKSVMKALWQKSKFTNFQNSLTFKVPWSIICCRLSRPWKRQICFQNFQRLHRKPGLLDALRIESAFKILYKTNGTFCNRIPKFRFQFLFLVPTWLT